MIAVPTTMANCIEVDSEGFITLRGDLQSPLTQLEAVELAYELLDSVRRSRDRNQMNAPAYRDSENIIRRMESPLGIALAATRRVF